MTILCKLFGAIIFTFMTSNISVSSAQTALTALFCDGKIDCEDGSDETMTSLDCPNCSASMIKCQIRFSECLINQEYICNGSIICDGIDPCDVGCPNYYRCRNNSCVRRSTICDGNPLSGCLEDDGWKTGTGFQCVRSGELCRLPQQLLLDDVQDCDQGEDLCYDWPEQSMNELVKGLRRNNSTPTFNQSRCFTCLDGSMVIPRQKVCDDVIDCSDLSDECLCEGRVPNVCEEITSRSQLLTSQIPRPACGAGQVDCGDGTCINRTSVCDGIRDCDSAIDERFTYCRGTLSCGDGTAEDELDECRCGNELHNIVGVLCDGVGQCPGLADDECSSQCPNSSSFNCTTMTRGASDSSLSSTIHCTSENESDPFCADRFVCAASGFISIAVDHVCDGTVDCDDGSDETNTTCPERFLCPVFGGSNKVSIDGSLVCDFIINCENGEDELNCTDDERYYCESGNPLFVRSNQLYDGRPDCSDMSDECPTTRENRARSVFATRYQLIVNPALRVIVWLMGILAFVGNLIVIFGEIKIFKSKKRRLTTSARNNHMLILNLALADFLMGIYLIMFGAAGAKFEGDFCVQEFVWRSGVACQAMGALVVISSETSVLTMVLLASVRLFVVLKPFDATTKPSKLTVLLLIIMTWAISLFVALIPFSKNLEFFFTTRAIIHDNLFFQSAVVSFEAAKDWAEKLITFSPELQTATRETVLRIRDAVSWSGLRSALGNVSEANVLQTDRFFGYYSSNGACIPRLFVTTQENIWKFSIAVTSFNFVAFVFVAFAYILIVIKARKKRFHSKNSSVHHARGEKGTTAMQRKIYRLLVTDFCCWVPISVMAFINLSGFPLRDIAYAISAIILLPINSALNPILYSEVLDRIFRKVGHALTSSGIWNSTSHSIPSSNVDVLPSATSRKSRTR